MQNVTPAESLVSFLTAEKLPLSLYSPKLGRAVTAANDGTLLAEQLLKSPDSLTGKQRAGLKFWLGK